MKIPKSVNIMGHTYEVKIKHVDGCGGSFNAATNIITIEPTDLDKAAILLHEMVEIILTQMRTFSDDVYGERKFVLVHHPHLEERADSFVTFSDILYDTLQRNNLI